MSGFPVEMETTVGPDREGSEKWVFGVPLSPGKWPTNTTSVFVADWAGALSVQPGVCRVSCLPMIAVAFLQRSVGSQANGAYSESLSCARPCDEKTGNSEAEIYCSAVENMVAGTTWP